MFESQMRQVVVRSNAPGRGRIQLATLAHFHAHGSFQLVQRLLNQPAQEPVHLAALDRLELVVARIDQETSEKERPRQVVARLLLGRNRARDNLGIQVVRQYTEQTRLDRKRLVEELLVEVLLDIVHHNYRYAAVVELRSTGAAHHLQHVRDGKVNVAFRLAVVVFGAFDDH